MKISLNWISDFVDVSGISPEEFGDRITIHTAEVDEIEEQVVETARIAAVRVTDVTKLDLPDRPGLTAVTLETGEGPARTVCGAPNVRAGMIALAAFPGATLSMGKSVESGEIAGHPSEVMLCSAKELGLWDNHEIIVELPTSVAPGTGLADLIQPRDTLLEIDNKSLTHRPDLWGQYGFARELAAILSRDLAPLPVSDALDAAGLPQVDIAVDAPDVVPFFSAAGLRVPQARVAPLTMRHRLGLVSSPSRDILVDVSNYVQFELGQPSHCFDARIVPSLRVDRVGAARQFTSLDDETHEVAAEDLMIFSGDEPVGLAGVIGGANSRIAPDTQDVTLECANFDGTRIRRTAARLGIRTDASQRYEKKLPVAFADQAPGRIFKLLQDAVPETEATAQRTILRRDATEPRRIHVAAGAMTRRAGADIPDAQSQGLLRSIGFGCEDARDGYTVTVPEFRGEADITTWEDLSEEVMRLFGYHNITPEMPGPQIGTPDFNIRIRGQHRARRILSQSYGFAEVKTYGWHSKDWLSKLGFERRHAPLTIVNPRGSDTADMRDTLIPNLLMVANENRRQAQAFRVYEIGKVFWIEAGEKVEFNRLAGLMVNQRKKASARDSFFELRRALEDIAVAANHPGFDAWHIAAEDREGPWQDGSAVALRIGDRTIGTMGVLPQKLVKTCLDAGHAIWFEIDIDEMATDLYPAHQHRADTPFPGSRQDFTFSWPVAEGYSKLHAVLAAYENPLLADWRLTDAFHKPGEAKANYTFYFHVQRPDRTVTSDDIAEFRADLLRYLEERKVESLST
ncbi:phenylalanine--tRNA ligase subunit beta [Roseivivax sediminis]|uniref:Phenylalanine--tRNA ligase beta subunit n=1 Tax=Roseivivax sediminis TaxID=936889 RepID=A0A1I1YES3_9RHOB|nr:phenylalanine--tRNA ligase subunit beta [Roseivivax sediminis]SFE18066.1 phenylalanyl-tRNA synthetase beta subunit [Roseivivax sediminis]